MFSTNSYAYLGDNPTDVDPVKSREPYCASKITMSLGPNQLHMLSSSNQKPNDSTTYDLIEKKMLDVQGKECLSTFKSKLNSWDVSEKVSNTCFNSCESDEIKVNFTKNNVSGAIGSKTFEEFKNNCRAYCKLSDAFRGKFLQEKTSEAEQMKAYLFQIKKLQESTCANNKDVDNSSRLLQKMREITEPSSANGTSSAIEK